MKYSIDHDIHIHSLLSNCSSDPEQTNENILAYGERNKLKYICMTNHFWDAEVDGMSGWYKNQNYEHLASALPLPQGANTAFKFGCETDMNKDMTIGIADEHFDLFDFVIISTTHLHMMGFTIEPEDDEPERRAYLYVKRLENLLERNYPFKKIGIAHLTCPHITPKTGGNQLRVLDLISDETFAGLFHRAAEKGAGIELNFRLSAFNGEEIERLLRPYRIAKREGCRFYLGSDSHHPSGFDGAIENFGQIIDRLELTEDDKFNPFA